MLNPGGSGCIHYILALPDLALKADIWEPEVLHAEDTIDTSECCIELGAVIHIARDHLCTHRLQLLRGGLVHVTRQRMHLPSVSQKFSCHHAALLTSCTGDCNYFIVHHLPLWFAISA